MYILCFVAAGQRQTGQGQQSRVQSQDEQDTWLADMAGVTLMHQWHVRVESIRPARLSFLPFLCHRYVYNAIFRSFETNSKRKLWIIYKTWAAEMVEKKGLSINWYCNWKLWLPVGGLSAPGGCTAARLRCQINPDPAARHCIACGKDVRKTFPCRIPFPKESFQIVFVVDSTSASCQFDWIADCNEFLWPP